MLVSLFHSCHRFIHTHWVSVAKCSWSLSSFLFISFLWFRIGTSGKNSYNQGTILLPLSHQLNNRSKQSCMLLAPLLHPVCCHSCLYVVSIFREQRKTTGKEGQVFDILWNNRVLYLMSKFLLYKGQVELRVWRTMKKNTLRQQILIQENSVKKNLPTIVPHFKKKMLSIGFTLLCFLIYFCLFLCIFSSFCFNLFS